MKNSDVLERVLYEFPFYCYVQADLADQKAIKHCSHKLFVVCQVTTLPRGAP